MTPNASMAGSLTPSSLAAGGTTSNNAATKASNGGLTEALSGSGLQPNTTGSNNTSKQTSKKTSGNSTGGSASTLGGAQASLPGNKKVSSCNLNLTA